MECKVELKFSSIGEMLKVMARANVGAEEVKYALDKAIDVVAAERQAEIQGTAEIPAPKKRGRPAKKEEAPAKVEEPAAAPAAPAPMQDILDMEEAPAETLATPPPAPTPAPAPAPASTVSEADARNLGVAYLKAKGRDAMIALLAKLGAKNISSLDATGRCNFAYLVNQEIGGK